MNSEALVVNEDDVVVVEDPKENVGAAGFGCSVGVLKREVLLDGSSFETSAMVVDFLSSTLEVSIVGFGEPNKKLLATGTSVVDFKVSLVVEPVKNTF